MSTGPEAAVPDLDLLRLTRSRTLGLVETLSQEEMDRRPAPGRWSVGEVLDHLLSTDEVSRREIGELIARRRAGQPAFVRRGFSELDIGIPFVPRALMPLAEVPFAVVNVFLPRWARDTLVRSRWLRALNPAVSEPRPGRPAGELRWDLELSLQAIERLLAEHRDLDLRELTYYHPALGHNDVPGLLRFVANHERRHQGQIREILAHPAAGGDPRRCHA